MSWKARRIDRIKNIGLRDGILVRKLDLSASQNEVIDSNDGLLTVNLIMNDQLIDRASVVQHVVLNGIEHPHVKRQAMQNKALEDRLFIELIERNYELLDAWLHTRLTEGKLTS